MGKNLSEAWKKKIKDEILIMIPDGVSDKKMAYNLGIDIRTVQFYINELINEDRTTREEIDKIREEKAKKIHDEKKQIVLEAIRAGKTKNETMSLAKVGMAQLNALTDELIAERNNRKRISRSKKKRSE